MYGWYPNREYTQLNVDASLNSTQIVLNDDLGLQQGDKIAIGIGTENYNQSSDIQIYTVQSYIAGTKTVTLTSTLLKNRLAGDYVAIVNGPIKISHTNPTLSVIDNTAIINNVVIIGVHFTGLQLIEHDVLHLVFNWNIKHCSFDNCGNNIYNVTIMGLKDSIVEDTLFTSNQSSFQRNLRVTFNRCIYIAEENDGQWNTNCVFNNCIIQNGWAFGPSDHNNCISKNCGGAVEYSNISQQGSTLRIKGCTIHSGNIESPQLRNSNVIFKDCTFKDNSLNYGLTQSSDNGLCAGYLSNISGKLYNCLFEGTEPSGMNLNDTRLANEIIESFDHNQIIGNYKAWMKEGIITTVNGKLNFACQSASYPVFKDYKISVEKDKIEQITITAGKDFTGGTVKAELIDPANDPLIDPTAVPLATVIMPDVPHKAMNLHYTPIKTQEVILRVSAINSTGNMTLKNILRSNYRGEEMIN
jgi:hypothetical protein